jgi:hypothetical protein
LSATFGDDGLIESSDDINSTGSWALPMVPGRNLVFTDDNDTRLVAGMAMA